MIGEIVVVEGIHDVAAVLRAVEAETIATGGHAFGDDVVARLRRGHAHRGLLVLTDPDSAGARIRRRVEALVGAVRHAHVPRERCTRDGDVGVEHAPPEVIRAALLAARATTCEPVDTFTPADLWAHGLTGGPGAAGRRAIVGARLGLGYGNARQLLRRLNRYGVTPQELAEALR